MLNYKDKNVTLDDIVFEYRNKEYGAYMLRKFYDDYIVRAMIIAATGFTLAMVGPMLWDKFKPEAPVEEEVEVVVEMKDLKPPPPVNPKTPPPPPMPAAPPPPQVTTVKFVPPEVAPDEEVVEDPPKLEDLKKGAISDVSQEGAPDAPVVDNIDVVGEGSGGPGVVAPQEEEIFTYAEQMPNLPDMAGFIQKNLKYPPGATRAEIQGVVYVQFVVEKDGSINGAKVVKGIGYGCDEEALRVVNKMPSWIPGKQGGRPVRVSVSLPIRFRLAN